MVEERVHIYPDGVCERWDGTVLLISSSEPPSGVLELGLNVYRNPFAHGSWPNGESCIPHLPRRAIGFVLDASKSAANPGLTQLKNSSIFAKAIRMEDCQFDSSEAEELFLGRISEGHVTLKIDPNCRDLLR
jgi:hypothetical protein